MFNLANSYEVKERIVKDVYVTLDGRRLNVRHTIELLDEVQNHAIEVTDRELGEHLIKHGILKTMGSRRWMMGAQVGPNFDAFMAELDALRERASREPFTKGI